MMPKKRSLSGNFESDGDDDSSAEEVVQADVKNIQGNADAMQEDEEGIPFLDTFHGLSSSSTSERAQAAHALLEHCLFGSNANVKDAAYALKRLFNGLCSGRASSRQGYASALTSFLKMSFQQEMIDDIQREYSGESEELYNPLVFIRNNLLDTTDPSKAQTGKFGKKKGSEERDYSFGRIFGILSVIRSGILLRNVPGESVLEEVAVGYANDLVELYKTKKWMREPATQGILTLLGSFFRSDNETTRAVLTEVVKQVLIPKLLILDSKGGMEKPALLKQYSPEQIAIAVQVQSISEDVALPFPLDEAILSTVNLTYLCDALASTSNIVHPRMHLVWDVLWSSLTMDTDAANAPKGKRSQARVLRQNAPASSETARDVVADLFRTVVIKCLLGIDQEGKSTSTTHEKRALALTLVKILCGGEYSSSTTGTVAMKLDLDLLEKVILCPTVVKRLFLDILSAGKGHMLKPLALHVLESIVPASEEEKPWEKRLAIAKTILLCDPRFDGLTKTRTVVNLLLLDETAAKGEADGAAVIKLWTEYVGFLKRSIMSLGSASDGEDETGEEARKSTVYKALGYVDLLYSATKHILHIQQENDDNILQEFKRTNARDVIGFLMASAFFDCSMLAADYTIEPITSSTKTKKKKKKKSCEQKNDDGNLHPAVKGGLFMQKVLLSETDEQEKQPALVPYAVRVTLSSRFYSLLADYISATAPRKSAKGETTVSGSGTSFETKQEKDSRVLDILSDACSGWSSLEEAGACSLPSTSGDQEDKEQFEKTKKSVREFQSHAVAWTETTKDEDDSEKIVKRKCAYGSSQLMSTLYLHLLHCGQPENISGEENVLSLYEDDDELDDSEIMELISDLSDVTKSLLGENNGEEERENPLKGLADLCVGILSSPLCSGSQTRGASSKIVRENVKSAWAGGLNAAILGRSSTQPHVLFDEDVVNALLVAVGVSNVTAETENDIDESNLEMDVDVDSVEESGDDGDDVVFSAKAAKALDIDSDEERNMDTATGEEDGGGGEENYEDDVELDPTQLQSLLLEDSDPDVDGDGELEHHAGADAALAQLIKLKKDARKVGKQARERLEVSNQLRCAVLIETLVSTLNSLSTAMTSNSTVRREVILQMLIPLIERRRSLEKSISSAELGKKGTGASEKRALRDRLTALLKTRICKMRLASFADDDHETTAPYVSDLALRILNEARKSNELGHGSCCSSALIVSLRSLPKPEEMVDSAVVYKEAVNEWSSKRTTRLNTSLFEDLIQQVPGLAQAVLTKALATATAEARSPFLKSEAFRLLACVYSTVKTAVAEACSLERIGAAVLEEVAPLVAKNAGEALQNSDMQKTKRVRDVLKAIEKVVSFVATTSSSNEALRLQLGVLRQHVDSLTEVTESHGVKIECENVLKEIMTYLGTVGISNKMDAEKEVVESKTTPNESKGSSSKKKKKKKGRRR